MEEADRKFFERVAKGFEAIAAAEPDRVRLVNGVGEVEPSVEEIWEARPAHAAARRALVNALAEFSSGAYF